MLRKWICVILFCNLAVTLFGCAAKTENEVVETETSSLTEEGTVVFDSSLGYTLEYDPALFYVLSDENGDTFGLWGEDADALLAFSLNAERVSGYTVKEYTEFVTNAVESGVWSVTEAAFGAKGENATTVMYSEETPAGSLHHAVTLIKKGYDIIVLDTVTYDAMSDEVRQWILDMQMTFQVK